MHIIKLMDEVAKVMARGLITLPSNVRKKIGIQEGDLVRIEVKGEEIVIKKEKRIYDLQGVVRETSQKEQKSFGEILAQELKKG